jgi:3-(3-hydroxy-phenyl)propionate hydroxylase
VLEVEPDSPLGTGSQTARLLPHFVRPDFTVLRASHDVAGLCEAAPRFLVA